MNSQVIVGVDFGSSRIKAAAYDRAGAMVALEAIETPIHHVEAGDDFPVLDLLAAAHHVVDALHAGPIAVLGMTSMGEVGTVLTGSGLAPLDFPAWYDDRGHEIITDLETEHGATHLRNLTGRHCRTTSTVAKLGHTHTSNRPVPGGVFLGLCGALAFQLTGRAWQEDGLATTSGVYDLLRRDHLPALWHGAGLGHIDLAPVRSAGHSTPAATPLARSLGLAAGAAVVIAGHDHPVASVGAGARTGEVSDSMGTGEAIIAALTGAPPTASQLAAHLDRDADLSFELWPADGSLLAVWERMRPGLAMRTFLEHSALERHVLDDGAAPPSGSVGFSPGDLVALQVGRRVESSYDALAWGELIDAYVLLANQGEALTREVTGAAGATVLTGGGLRSRRWRQSKVALGPAELEVSTVAEAATRGCAAIAGTALGWWPRAEDMPGDVRRAVRSAVEMEQVATTLEG